MQPSPIFLEQLAVIQGCELTGEIRHPKSSDDSLIFLDFHCHNFLASLENKLRKAPELSSNKIQFLLSQIFPKRLFFAEFFLQLSPHECL